MMAGAFVGEVLDGLQDAKVPSGAKLVAVALAEAANIKHGGVAWPSVETISRKASLSTNQTRAHLQLLEARGWTAKENAGTGGAGVTTRYRLNLERLRQKPPTARRVKASGAPESFRTHDEAMPKDNYMNGNESHGFRATSESLQRTQQKPPTDRTEASSAQEGNRKEPELKATGIKANANAPRSLVSLDYFQELKRKAQGKT
jgi:hypothetical protein